MTKDELLNELNNFCEKDLKSIIQKSKFYLNKRVNERRDLARKEKSDRILKYFWNDYFKQDYHIYLLKEKVTNCSLRVHYNIYDTFFVNKFGFKDDTSTSLDIKSMVADYIQDIDHSFIMITDKDMKVDNKLYNVKTSETTGSVSVVFDFSNPPPENMIIPLCRIMMKKIFNGSDYVYRIKNLKMLDKKGNTLVEKGCEFDIYKF